MTSTVMVKIAYLILQMRDNKVEFLKKVTSFKDKVKKEDDAITSCPEQR